MEEEECKTTQEKNKKYCKRCHRELKSDKSKQLGYGVVCYKKLIKNKSLYLFELEDNRCLNLKAK